MLSCDNIQANGAVLREAVLAHARLRGATGDLAGWIADAVRFPSTMVDRITPVTSPADTERLATQYDLADRWPVVCETFSQWVIEDRFLLGRPAWERVGAQFVDDVEPYELISSGSSTRAISQFPDLVGSPGMRPSTRRWPMVGSRL